MTGGSPPGRSSGALIALREQRARDAQDSLDRAVVEGDLPAFEAALENADPNLPDAQGRTVLHRVAESRHVDMAEALYGDERTRDVPAADGKFAYQRLGASIAIDAPGGPEHRTLMCAAREIAFREVPPLRDFADIGPLRTNASNRDLRDHAIGTFAKELAMNTSTFATVGIHSGPQSAASIWKPACTLDGRLRTGSYNMAKRFFELLSADVGPQTPAHRIRLDAHDDDAPEGGDIKFIATLTNKDKRRRQLEGNIPPGVPIDRHHETYSIDAAVETLSTARSLVQARDAGPRAEAWMFGLPEVENWSAGLAGEPEDIKAFARAKRQELRSMQGEGFTWAPSPKPFVAGGDEASWAAVRESADAAVHMMTNLKARFIAAREHNPLTDLGSFFYNELVDAIRDSDTSGNAPDPVARADAHGHA